VRLIVNRRATSLVMGAGRCVGWDVEKEVVRLPKLYTKGAAIG
jgi:hypothetical protein